MSHYNLEKQVWFAQGEPAVDVQPVLATELMPIVTWVSILWIMVPVCHHTSDSLAARATTGVRISDTRFDPLRQVLGGKPEALAYFLELADTTGPTHINTYLVSSGWTKWQKYAAARRLVDTITATHRVSRELVT